MAASALDPARLLLGRDFARMVLRARAAGVSLVPVLLTSPSVPKAQNENALRALAAACGVDAETGVRVVVVDDALLLARGLSASTSSETFHDALAAATGSAPGQQGTTPEARQKRVCGAPGAANVRHHLQALLQREQSIFSLRKPDRPPTSFV